jgi:hypothetical protein
VEKSEIEDDSTSTTSDDSHSNKTDNVGPFLRGSWSDDSVDNTERKMSGPREAVAVMRNAVRKPSPTRPISTGQKKRVKHKSSAQRNKVVGTPGEISQNFLNFFYHDSDFFVPALLFRYF